MIKKYNSFINESLGIIPSKYDLTEMTDVFFRLVNLECCDEIFEYLEFSSSGRALILCANISNKKLYIMSYYSERIASYSPKSFANYHKSVFGHIDGDLCLGSQWFEMEEMPRLSIISHELSHALDPSPIELLRRKTIKNFIVDIIKKYPELSQEITSLSFDYDERDPDMNLAKQLQFLSKISKKIDNKDYKKLYVSLQGETEAYLGMIIYALNSLLNKNSDKIETIKNMIKKGNIDFENVFPEFKNLSSYLDIIKSQPDILNKLKKRIGILVSNPIDLGTKVEFRVNPTLTKYIKGKYDKDKNYTNNIKDILQMKIWGNFEENLNFFEILQ